MAAITLTIVYDGKTTNVSGPLDNQLLCYGLLAMARDIIADYKADKADQRIQTVGALPPGLLKP